MSESKRRFFSADSLEAALVAAASEYGLSPEEVAYRRVEKRHGFVRVRRNVVIEVDPDAPRKKVEGVETGDTRSPAALPAGGPRSAGGGGSASGRGRTARAGGADQQEKKKRKDGAALRPEARGVKDGAERGAAPPPTDLPLARGPLAEGAGDAIDALLDLIDLDVDARVLEGEERFEVEVFGRDRDVLLSDDGELLAALEVLVPRVMRGTAGRSYPCRVDCENFHEEREERLRSLAREVAAEVAETRVSRRLEPMTPGDRRIVHLALCDEPAVVTESEGVGYRKRVRISPAGEE